MSRRWFDSTWLFWATIAALAAALLAGCVIKRFQREHEAHVIHIFGIGWIMHGTNATRVFGIGNVDAGIYKLSVNTNAPTVNKPDQ